MKILKWLFGMKNEEVEEIESQENNDLKINNGIIEPEAICPYCKIVLNKFPLRKTKCPHCENFIFIRKLADSKNKTLITEEQAQEIEIEKEKNYQKNTRLSKLREFGITEDEFIRLKEEHYLKYGIENNDNDVFWSIFNQLLIKNVNDGNKLLINYYSMAVFLHQEGKDNFKLLQLSAKATLDSYQDSNLALNFQIISSKDSCENCKKMDGKIISIEQAYLLPVPCRECTNSIGFCRCTYGAVPIRDNEGMLMLKK
jgi:hypothetical protein